jgi:methylthioribose-1-phosphate isomerase
MATTRSECTGEVRPVYFAAGVLHLIDQRELPAALVTVALTTAADVHRCIRDMTVRGAPAIGAAGAFGLVLAARASAAATPAALVDELRAAKAFLDSSRPTAVNLEWATARMVDIAAAYGAHAGMTVPRLAAALEAEAQALAEEDVETNRALARHGAALVPQGANVLHHCAAAAVAAAARPKRGSCAARRLIPHPPFPPQATLARSRRSTLARRWASFTRRTSRARASTCGSTRRGHGCKARS